MSKTTPHWRNFLICAALVLLTGIVYFQVGHFEFTNFDDNMFVVSNHHLEEGLTLHSLSWAATTNYGYNWHPLTWFSFLLDYQLWGRDAGNIHLVNAALHVASAALLFLALVRMTAAPWRSGFVAALFALHPAHVESVAWVAERKDVLSAFFWMLTLLAYARYAEKPKLDRYLLTLGCYALSLLAKPMAMTLPFVLLLLDYWPLGRTRWLNPVVGHRTPPTIGRLLLEKIPLLALAIVTGALAFWAQSSGGAIAPSDHLPLAIRIENSFVSYVRYIGMMLWPIHLSVLYSYAVWRTSVVATAAALLAAITIFVVRQRKSEPFLLVGWFWFLIILAPAIGLVQLGRQALVDHHTYLSFIGLFIVLAWAVPDSWLRQPARRTAAGIIGVAVLAICSVLTWNQLQNWQDSEALFQHVLDVIKPSSLARGYMIWHEDQPLPSEIKGVWFEDGMQLVPEPNFAEAYSNLGVALMDKHHVSQALQAYRNALHFEPGQAGLHVNMAIALGQEGEKDEAIAEYKKAILLKPDDDKLRTIAANGLFSLGDAPDGIVQYRLLTQTQPENAFIHNNLGYALQMDDKIDEAIVEYKAALHLDPRNLAAHFNLASAWCVQGKLTEAEREYRVILQIRPNDPTALQNLNSVLAREGNLRRNGSQN